MRVLITGGAGFIGSHIVSAFQDAGHEIVALDGLLPTAHPTAPSLPESVEWIRADVRDSQAVGQAMRGVDVVCHQAAMVGLSQNFADIEQYVACNELGTAVLLAAMAEHRVGALVLAGSMVVYGEGTYYCQQHGTVRPGQRTVADLEAGQFETICPYCRSSLACGLVDEDTAMDPRNVYASTKVSQEHLASSWARATGGSGISLRYHNVYGPRMPRDTPYAGVASFFRSALAAGRAPTVFEDGGQRRDFVHVADIASANVAAASALPHTPSGHWRPYNVASGEPHTIGDMANALAAAYGGPQPRVTGEYRLGDVRHITASIARITSELEWKPQVGFHTGMSQFASAPLRGDAPQK